MFSIVRLITIITFNDFTDLFGSTVIKVCFYNIEDLIK